MGNQPGHPVIRNSSRYQIHITGYTDRWLWPGDWHQFQCDYEHFNVHITALEGQREMKKKSFDSWKHHSWDICNDWIQRHGDANMQHPEGHYEYWSTDNTSYWAQIDQQAERARREEAERNRQEEERRRQEEEEKRREEEERQRQEEEERRRQEEEEERTRQEEEERQRREEEEQRKEEEEGEKSVENLFEDVENEELEKRRTKWADKESEIEAERLATDFVERNKSFVPGQAIDDEGAPDTTISSKNKDELDTEALSELFNILLDKSTEHNLEETSKSILKMVKNDCPIAEVFWSQCAQVLTENPDPTVRLNIINTLHYKLRDTPSTFPQESSQELTNIFEDLIQANFPDHVFSEETIYSLNILCLLLSEDSSPSESVFSIALELSRNGMDLQDPLLNIVFKTLNKTALEIIRELVINGHDINQYTERFLYNAINGLFNDGEDELGEVKAIITESIVLLKNRNALNVSVEWSVKMISSFLDGDTEMVLGNFLEILESILQNKIAYFDSEMMLSVNNKLFDLYEENEGLQIIEIQHFIIGVWNVIANEKVLLTENITTKLVSVCSDENFSIDIRNVAADTLQALVTHTAPETNVELAIISQFLNSEEAFLRIVGLKILKVYSKNIDVSEVIPNLLQYNFEANMSEEQLLLEIITNTVLLQSVPSEFYDSITRKCVIFLSHKDKQLSYRAASLMTALLSSFTDLEHINSEDIQKGISDAAQFDQLPETCFLHLSILSELKEKSYDVDDELHFHITHQNLRNRSCANFVLKYLAETISISCTGHESEILEDILNLGREWILENCSDTVVIVLSKMLEDDRWDLKELLAICFLCDAKIQQLHIIVKRMLDANDPQNSLDAYLKILQSSISECDILEEIWTVLDSYADSDASPGNEIFLKTVLVLTELSNFVTETTISYLISEVNQEDSALKILALNCIFHAVKNCSVTLNDELVNGFLKWLEDDNLRMLTYSVIFMTTVDQQILPDDLITYLCQVLTDREDSPKIISLILACARDNSQDLDESTVTLLDQLLKDDDGNWASSSIKQFSTKIKHVFENGRNQTEEQSYEWRDLHITVAFLENVCVNKEQSEQILQSLLSNEDISDDKRAYIFAHAAVFYLSAGENDASMEYFTKALELKNDYAWASHMLCRTIFLWGDYEEALLKIQDLPDSEGYFFSQNTIPHLRSLCETVKEKYEDDISTELIRTMLVKLEGHPNARKVLSFLGENSENITDDIILSIAVEDWVEAVLLNTVKSNLDDKENETLLAEIDEAWKTFQCYHGSYLRYSEESDNLLIDIVNTYVPENVPDMPKILKYCCVGLELVQSFVVEKSSVENLKDMWFKDRISMFFPDFDDGELAATFEEYKQTCMSECIDLTEDFLDCFCPVNSLADLKEFYRFLSQENIENLSVSRLVLPLETKESRNLSEKRKILEREWISKYLEIIWSADNFRNAAVYFLEELHEGSLWSFHFIKSILEVFHRKFEEQAENCSQHFTEALSVIFSYRISDQYIDKTGRTVLSIIQDENPEDWQAHINTLALDTYYSEGTEEYEVESFCAEAQQMNDQSSDLEEEISKVKEIFHKIHLSLANGIEEWSSDDIKSWVDKIRESSHDEENLPEIIAVLCQATKLHKGYFPRTAQIISLLLLLEAKNNGRLAKINTGEGKSTIVSMLAVVQALRGYYVDIITSSAVLAERDAEEFESFYDMFSLTSGSCFKGKDDGIEKCYMRTILYGDSSTMEADVLRQEFSLLNTRDEREFHTVIVDEVDSMLIDQGGHSTRLVDKMPGMENMLPTLALIWVHTNVMMDKVVQIGSHNWLAEDSKTPITSVYEALFQYMPREIREQHQLTDGDSLSAALQRFADESMKKELDSKEVRETVLDILLNAEDDQFCREYPVSDESTFLDEVIDKFIKCRWDFTNQKNVLQIAEKFNKVRIQVLNSDVYEETLQSDNLFHLENDFKEKIRFMHYNGCFVHLKSVDSDLNQVKSLVAQEVRKSLDLPNTKSDIPPEQRLKVPKHLERWCSLKLSKWVDSAMNARFFMVENRDYLIKNNKDGVSTVVPIDYENTGIIQDGTVWSDGLHQFLQMKHHLKITPENLANNFLSNMAFFKRYTKKIYGLTGTLGSQAERRLLSEIYNVDTIEIPTFRLKRFLDLTSILTQKRDDWLFQICNSVTTELRKGRGSLIICKSIKDVGLIRNHLQNFLDKNNVPLENMDIYIRSDEDSSEMLKDKLQKGSVLLATNLAGRGTDIKLSDEVVENGGLHVCITFLPQNIRVEQQAAGRASRQGQPGTAQLVIYKDTDEKEELLFSADSLKAARDEVENTRVQTIVEKTIPGLCADEEYFQAYCQLRSSVAIPGNDNNENVISAIDERFGIHLDISKLETTNNERRQNDFQTFLSDLENDLNSDNAATNPAYDIFMGNKAIRTNNNDYAVGCFNAAITKDPHFCHNAHYYKAYCQVLSEHKSGAISSLEKTMKQIEQQLNLLVVTNNLLENNRQIDLNQDVSKSEEGDSDFTKQTIMKMNLLQIQAKSIEKAFEMINEHDKVTAEIIPPGDFLKQHDVQLPVSEIVDIQASGVCGFISIKKVPPPWYAVLVVILVGICQAVVGAVLAVSTMGAFGTGFIVDGVTDVVKGIKSAVNGEYISLSDFFKEKAIGWAIGLVVSAIGSFASAAVNAVSTAAKSVISKVAGSAFGKAVTSGLSKIGSSAIRTGTSSMFKKGLGLVIKGYNWTKSTFNVIKDGVMNQTKSLLSKLKNGLKCIWKKVSSKLEYISNKIGVTRAAKACQQAIAKQVGNRAILCTKIILTEFTKQGVTELANWVVDKTLLEHIRNAIKRGIENNIEEKLKVEICEGNIGHKIEELIRKSETAGKTMKTIIHELYESLEDESVDIFSYVSTSAKFLVSAIKSKSPKTWLEIVEKIIESITSLVEFVEFIKDLVTYVDGVLEILDSRLSEALEEVADTNSNTSDSLTMDIEEFKTKLACEFQSKISEKMADLIENTLVKPAKSFCVSKMTKNLKYDSLLKDSKSFTRTNETKNLQDLEDTAYEPPKKSSSLPANFGIGNRLDVTPIERSHTIGATPGELADLSSTTGKPVQLYRMNAMDSLEFERCMGRGPVRKQSSLRLLFRPPTEEGSRGSYDIIQQDKSGEIMIVPLQGKKSPLRKLGILTDNNIFAKVKEFCLLNADIIKEAKEVSEEYTEAVMKTITE